MAQIFISYRRDDAAGYAGRLRESLERRLGTGEVFRDVDGLAPGQDFVDAIMVRLRNCRVCLVLIGREWLEANDEFGRRGLDQPNDYVRLEIVAALARPDVRVVPVLLEGMTMPSPEQLPDAIRALARRHAMSLRDEAWDSDVDRLVATTSKRRPRAFNLKWAAVAAALLGATLLARAFLTNDGESAATADTDRAVVRDGAGATVAPVDTVEAAPTSGIAIPRLAEIAHGNLIYTVLSGDIASTRPRRRLRLRVRFSNDGPYPANFWDGSFRLAVGGQVLEPTSGLNEVVGGHASQQGVVSFDVPADTGNAVLRVLGSGNDAELPLDLTPTGARSEVDSRDTGDALSRAVVVGLVREARPVVSGKEITYTLMSAGVRRFVNTLRIVATVRMTNHARYPANFGTGAVRLLVDGQATAPFEGPNAVVAPDASETADFVFDVPPATGRAVLRVSGESVAEVPLDLPSQ